MPRGGNRSSVRKRWSNSLRPRERAGPAGFSNSSSCRSAHVAHECAIAVRRLEIAPNHGARDWPSLFKLEQGAVRRTVSICRSRRVAERFTGIWSHAGRYKELARCRRLSLPRSHSVLRKTAVRTDSIRASRCRVDGRTAVGHENQKARGRVRYVSICVLHGVLANTALASDRRIRLCDRPGVRWTFLRSIARSARTVCQDVADSLPDRRDVSLQ